MYVNSRQVIRLEPSTKLDNLIAFLAENSVRITAKRTFLLDLIVRLDRPFSAIEVYQMMEKNFPGLSYGTVYRNLELYKKYRIIEVFALGNELRYRVIDHIRPQLHFICMDCKHTIPLTFDPEQMKLPKPEQFRSMNYKIDVFGYCMDCEDEENP